MPVSLLEQIKKFEETEKEILEQLTEHELLIDSKEQVIERL